ncbi:DUF421 domain-containing protein [Erythrobacter litoralis]|uniref:YetF C-terminal domain-containing protein n=1 Tax=Erythrobacter litoralis (strain HTCC2594) TaxID=314225 RepID=Q2N8Q6_ERYLH|nr:YetF domain-containing protein [Erythrobacter litoralis]ABC63935.1 hypothetical protein ELI_09215 [Erythrobacter litoralis HTCC2594]
MFTDATWLDVFLRGFLLSGIGLVYVVFLVRMIGLRSFSKMTNFDFVMTVASGSLLAGAAQATDWAGFAQAMIAMTGLFTAQLALSRWRKNSDWFEQLMQNDAVLLMRNGEFCEKAMKEERVAKSDVIAKLREANVLELSKVRAVVLETTGDVSVMHGDVLEDVIIENVRSVD